MRALELQTTTFISCPVQGTVLCGTTGFQSPADDYEQERIDLAKELVTTISSVFVARAVGRSMEKAGIYDGDLLVFDRGLEPKSGNIVVADVHDVRMVKRIRIVRGRCFLMSEGEDNAEIAVDPDQGVLVIGVLKHAVRSF